MWYTCFIILIERKLRISHKHILYRHRKTEQNAVVLYVFKLMIISKHMTVVIKNQYPQGLGGEEVEEVGESLHQNPSRSSLEK